jgi:hypothetical protein
MRNNMLLNQRLHGYLHSRSLSRVIQDLIRWSILCVVPHDIYSPRRRRRRRLLVSPLHHANVGAMPTVKEEEKKVVDVPPRPNEENHLMATYTHHHQDDYWGLPRKGAVGDESIAAENLIIPTGGQMGQQQLSSIKEVSCWLRSGDIFSDEHQLGVQLGSSL